jgi:hypothetical protein
MARPTEAAAIRAIEEHGCLLVYPIDNRPEPGSLWRVFYPRTPMRWEWDESGDDRVAHLWHLRTELSRSGQVVYAKWYRGRATFFSRELFMALLARLGSTREDARRELSPVAREILGVLEMDSPLSTKQIKAATDLRGRANEPRYERAMKELWSRLLVVGFGEFEDGAFPSLAVGATKLLFEDLWNDARELSPDEALAEVRLKLEASPPIGKFLRSLQA